MKDRDQRVSEEEKSEKGRKVRKTEGNLRSGVHLKTGRGIWAQVKEKAAIVTTGLQRTNH